jgi:hypothetical protein
VAQELATLFQVRSEPATVVSDSGTEFTSNAILIFAADRQIDWHPSDLSPIFPPWQGRVLGLISEPMRPAFPV